MNELERKIKSKIPGNDTGIEVKHTLCDICSPGMHCGVDASVRDGVIVKIEGTDNHPKNNGMLCTKGLAGRSYVYREDRIQTPLRRTGERGEGRFEPISWEVAYSEIARHLLDIKSKYGAEAVAFYSGYSKWYRQMLRRLAHSFGSYNFGSESSSCYTSAFMAWKLAAGQQGNADMDSSDLFLGWAFNPFYSNYLSAKRAVELKEKGLKYIIVDVRRTPSTEKLADLSLFPRPGTDGALAHCIANILIRNGWTDEDYIRDYVYGFEEYKDYVSGFNESNIETLTGVPYKDAFAAAQMIAQSKATSMNESSAPLCHHRNGLQNYRAVIALLAITGNFDRTGGQFPITHTFMHTACGFETKEHEYITETRPKSAKRPIGGERFPLWEKLEGEMQAMDLPRQILEQTPYPVKGIFALGLNARMWPDSKRMFTALSQLDFYCDTDLFMTDSAKYADIVLPACSSFERGEFKPYAGGYAVYTKPAIAPLYQSKPDTTIIAELANALDLDDELLRGGYKDFILNITRDLPVTLEQLENAVLPIRIAEAKPKVSRAASTTGLLTLTGKFELKSTLIEAHPEWGLNALPTYRPPLDDADEAKYPFVLTAGARIPGALHSRLHRVPTARALQKDPTADINPDDARELALEKGDEMEIFTDRGSIMVKANPNIAVRPSNVLMYHGYSEADVNSLLDGNHLDPYSGFAAFRSTRCGLRKRVII